MGCFRKGDSGRGSDGRLGLKVGLGGLAAGPTDCENLGLRPGVVMSTPFTLLPFSVLYEGVVGVVANVSEAVGEDLLSAR